MCLLEKVSRVNPASKTALRGVCWRGLVAKWRACPFIFNGMIESGSCQMHGNQILSCWHRWWGVITWSGGENGTVDECYVCVSGLN